MPDQPQEEATKFLTCVCAHTCICVHASTPTASTIHSLSFRNYPLVHPSFSDKKVFTTQLLLPGTLGWYHQVLQGQVKETNAVAKSST